MIKEFRNDESLKFGNPYIKYHFNRENLIALMIVFKAINQTLLKKKKMQF